MPDAPEATTETVQLPAASPRQEAIALAQADMERPEAVVEGTAPAPEPDIPVEEAPATDLEDIRMSREEVDRLLQRQKASMKAELDQARVLTERGNLLKELDTLMEEDPDAWTRRVNEDPNAAAAIADRASAVAPDVIVRARTEVVMDQARMMLEARPDLAAVFEEQGEEWQKAVNPQTGGVFGYIHRTALDQGKTQGVEDYKKSADFKKAIEDAERRGAHNALGGIESPPPSEEGGMVTTAERKYDDPRKEAIRLANKTFGRQVADPAGVGGRRRSS